MSNNTLLSYKTDLQNFFDNISINTVDEFSKEIILNYVSLLHSNYSISTISRRLSCLRAFFNFLESEKIINIVFSNLFLLPKKPFVLPIVLSVDDINIILSELKKDTSYIGIRNLTIIEFLYSTGCRVSELCSLNINDLHSSDDNKYFLVSGKGNKQRYIFINESTYKTLIFYLENSRSRFVKKNNKTDYSALFYNLHGSRISRQTVWEIVSKCKKYLSLDIALYPHIFRHSFATHLIQNGADVLSVKDLLGHSSINTTQIYTNISLSSLYNVFNNYHPRL